MSLELLVTIAVFFAVLGFSIAVLSLGDRKSALLQARLSRHAVRVAVVTPQRIARVNVLGKSPGRISPPLARRLAQLSFVQKSRVTLIHANVKFGVGRYYLFRVLLAALAFGVVQVVSGNPALAVGIALAAFMIPRIVVSQKASRRAAAFENLLAETLDLFVGSLRAGQGLLQAIESSSYEQPEPMRSELRRIVGQVTMGVSITDALESLTTRFDSRDVDLLAAAIAVNRETGGNLTEVLERLAKTVRQRREIRAEAKSLTAAPRATSYILVILPFVITGYSVAVSPIYQDQLLHSPIGRLLLIGAIIWSLIGFLISQKLAKAEY
ncbi:MAG: type II secretion system F family protein [Thermomicrobiales bacterium]